MNEQNTDRRRKKACHVPTFLGMLVLGAVACQAQQDEDLEIPEVETVNLETKDYVELHCSYYPGGVREKARGELESITGKKVVPVILLHGWGENEDRRRYDYLASYLQRLGHAVIVPDLRGHGESIRVKGVDQPIDPERFPKQLLETMIFDLDAVRKFLLEKNNAAELNIDQLCLVAADHVCMVAMNWAAKEWNKRDLIGVRRGKDIKAMVLLSPTRSFKGYTITQTIRQHFLFASRTSPFHMPLMIFVGKNDRTAYQDTETLYSMIDRARPELNLEDVPPAERNRKRAEEGTRFLVELDTQLQGTTLVDERLKMNVERSIAGFIHFKVVMKANEYEWTDRS